MCYFVNRSGEIFVSIDKSVEINISLYIKYLSVKGGGIRMISVLKLSPLLNNQIINLNYKLG